MVIRHIHFADIFEAVADAIPDKPALVTPEVHLTYGELDQRATRLANHLRASGVGVGEHVGIHARNCAEWVEAFYACFKARAVPVNVNYRYVENELRYLYDNSDCVAVVVAPEYVGALDAVSDALPHLRHRLTIGEEYEQALAAASPERDFGERSPDDVYIVYTGGTTGMPKGVLWRQEDWVLAALNAMRYGRPLESCEQVAEEAKAAPAQIVLLSAGPMMHGGTQWVSGNAHVAGGCFALYTGAKYDPYGVLALAERSGTNSLTVLGDAMARPLAEALLAPDRPQFDLSKLAAISNGAAPLTAGVRDELRAALPGVMIVDAYGSSETGSAAQRADAGESYTAPRFTAGPDTAVFSHTLERCDTGQVGLLARSGPIPLGYYKDPEKTAATFPTIEGKRWAISGDEARIEDDGTITILGRGSSSINSGGEKIHPEEVESVLLQHPMIFDAAVVGTPSERWGEQVTALVELREGMEMSPDEVQAHTKTLLAGFKAPKEVLFVEEVPRTPVGKVDYKQAKLDALRLLGLPPK